MKNAFYFILKASSYRATLATFQPRLKKLKKKTSEKNSYIFSKRSFSYISHSGTLIVFQNNFFYISEGHLQSLENKKIYSEEICYNFSKKLFPTFRDDCRSSRKIKKYIYIL